MTRRSNVTTVDGGLDTSIVGELQPETSYCFQLQAVRGDQTSPQSPKQCATTAVAPPASASPSPSADATAASSSPSGADRAATIDRPVHGRFVAGGASAGQTRRRRRRPAGGSAGGGGVRRRPRSAVAAQSRGGGSAAAGATSTAAVHATGTAPAGNGSFTPTQYINVVFTIPAADSEAAGRAELRRQQFEAAGIPALILRTKDYPQLQLIRGQHPGGFVPGLRRTLRLTGRRAGQVRRGAVAGRRSACRSGRARVGEFARVVSWPPTASGPRTSAGTE